MKRVWRGWRKNAEDVRKLEEARYKRKQEVGS